MKKNLRKYSTMETPFTRFPAFLVGIALLLLAATISSCEEDDNDNGQIPVASVSITAPQSTVNVDETLQLTATVAPENATNTTVTWSSSDPAIATVDPQTGLVEGEASGTVTLTAISQEDDTIKDEIQLRIIGTDEIPSFTIEGLESVEPTITANEVLFEIDFNKEGKELDVAALRPTITHNGADIDPASGAIQDFTGAPLTYTLTGNDGETRTYAVAIKTKPGTEFITTWNTATITVPTNSSLIYNYNIDINNDGFIDQTGITEDATVTFPDEERTLRISGQFPAIFFNLNGSEAIIESLEQWGTVAWASMGSAFAGCDNLQVPATDIPDLSGVTNMSFMFSLATSADPIVSQWNTAKVTDMRAMFAGATSADPDVSGWNTANVTDMTVMFAGATSADPDVSGWNTTNVENMDRMFSLATSADPDVSGWNTAKVTNMTSVFSGATNADPDVSQWNTVEVTRMGRMFAGATNAKPDVSQWNTAKVTDMTGMFSGATNANPDVSQWNISSILLTTFSGLTNIFENSNLSRENYEKALIRFAEHSINPNNEGLVLPAALDLGSVPVTFCSQAAADAKTILENNDWEGIGDKGTDCPE